MKYLNQEASYKYLMQRFIASNKEDLLSVNPTFSKEIEDYKTAFDYIENFSRI